MPDISVLFKNWWKQIFILVVVCVLAVGVVIFLKPKKYLSVATSVAASTFSTDPSRIFNKNIQQLYSALGTADDLDQVIGIADLDTIYLTVTDQFNLFDHYKIKEQGSVARDRSAALLRKNSKVMKTEYGALKVKVWDTDRNLAPQLANAITDRLQQVYTDLQNAGNQTTLAALLKQKEKSRDTVDSHGTDTGEYDRMISQYQLLVDNKPPALLVVEKAKAAAWPDKPRIFQTLAATALLSLLFSFLLALVLERKKVSQP